MCLTWNAFRIQESRMAFGYFKREYRYYGQLHHFHALCQGTRLTVSLKSLNTHSGFFFIRYFLHLHFKCYHESPLYPPLALKYLFYLCEYTVAVFRQNRRGNLTLYRWLWAIMWLLGIELRTSEGAVSTLNCWTIISSPLFWVFN